MKRISKKWSTIAITSKTKQLTAPLLPAIGAFLAIFIVYTISYQLTDLRGASAILPSMGAVTALFFANPDTESTKAKSLFAGNILSAAIGVFCYQWLGDTLVAASCAVSLSIFIMLACRCMHPPGGATALAAVVGGDAIYQLGYAFVIFPTLLNCLTIFIIFCIFDRYTGKTT